MKFLANARVRCQTHAFWKTCFCQTFRFDFVVRVWKLKNYVFVLCVRSNPNAVFRPFEIKKGMFLVSTKKVIFTLKLVEEKTTSRLVLFLLKKSLLEILWKSLLFWVIMFEVFVGKEKTTLSSLLPVRNSSIFSNCSVLRS